MIVFLEKELAKYGKKNPMHLRKFCCKTKESTVYIWNIILQKITYFTSNKHKSYLVTDDLFKDRILLSFWLV